MLYGGISRLSAIIVFYRKCNFIITDELFNRKMWRKRKHPPKRDSQGKFAEKCSPPRKKYKYLNSAKKAIKEVGQRRGATAEQIVHYACFEPDIEIYHQFYMSKSLKTAFTKKQLL